MIKTTFLGFNLIQRNVQRTFFITCSLMADSRMFSCENFDAMQLPSRPSLRGRYQPGPLKEAGARSANKTFSSASPSPIPMPGEAVEACSFHTILVDDVSTPGPCVSSADVSAQFSVSALRGGFRPQLCPISLEEMNCSIESADPVLLSLPDISAGLELPELEELLLDFTAALEDARRAHAIVQSMHRHS
jgi:hypothetical protein